MTAYEISVKGHVGTAVLAGLDAQEVARRPALTILRSDLGDADELRRLLDRLSDLGLELVEVRQVEAGG